jgi:NAD+ synthase
MDLCLYGRNYGIQATALASAVGLTTEQVERVYKDIDSKRITTRPLHLSSLLVEDVL